MSLSKGTAKCEQTVGVNRSPDANWYFLISLVNKNECPRASSLITGHLLKWSFTICKVKNKTKQNKMLLDPKGP